MSDSLIPVLTTVAEVRSWRQLQRSQNKEVGFVPTMGALHSGHLSLVQASLSSNAATIISIFVNPAQFAPHEDLSTYPRTFPSDSALLASLSPKPDAIFLPPVEALYPGGVEQDVSKQRGAFVEVKGLQEVMEGRTRPTFFRGVATVVLKLFNIIEPTRAYFGQKDIQQALLLRRLLTDLHLSHPLPNNMFIQPTYRDPFTSLALSSRNTYLTPGELKWADLLIRGLRAGEEEWSLQRTSPSGIVTIAAVLSVSRTTIDDLCEEAKKDGVSCEFIYLAMNDPVELHDLEVVGNGKVEVGKGAVLSGAVMMGRTRLIDNLVFDFVLNP